MELRSKSGEYAARRDDAAVGECDAATCKPEKIRVMSYNIKVAPAADVIRRSEQVYTMIMRCSPDLLGVQEACEEWMDYLKGALVGYTCVGIGRDPGGTGEASALFFRTDRFDLLDSGTFWLSPTPKECSFGWGAACRRVCSWAILTSKHTGDTFLFSNAHTDHISEEARRNGTALITRHARLSGYPAILTGDYNLEEGSPIYQAIVSSGFADSKYIALSSDTGGTFHDWGAIDYRTSKPIDFCFVSAGCFDVYDYKVMRDDMFDGAHASDHYPICVDLSLKHPPQNGGDMKAVPAPKA